MAQHAPNALRSGTPSQNSCEQQFSAKREGQHCTMLLPVLAACACCRCLLHGCKFARVTALILLVSFRWHRASRRCQGPCRRQNCAVVAVAAYSWKKSTTAQFISINKNSSTVEQRPRQPQEQCARGAAKERQEQKQWLNDCMQTLNLLHAVKWGEAESSVTQQGVGRGKAANEKNSWSRSVA